MHEICHLKIPPTQNTKSHFHHTIFVRNNWGLKLFVLKLKCTINKYIESSHCWMGDDVGPTLLMFFIWLPWLYWHLFNCNFTTTVTSKSIPCQNSCIPGARLVFHRPSKLQRSKIFWIIRPLDIIGSCKSVADSGFFIVLNLVLWLLLGSSDNQTQALIFLFLLSFQLKWSF